MTSGHFYRPVPVTGYSLEDLHYPSRTYRLRWFYVWYPSLLILSVGRKFSSRVLHGPGYDSFDYGTLPPPPTPSLNSLSPSSRSYHPANNARQAQRLSHPKVTSSRAFFRIIMEKNTPSVPVKSLRFSFTLIFL